MLAPTVTAVLNERVAQQTRSVWLVATFASGVLIAPESFALCRETPLTNGTATNILVCNRLHATGGR